ncbi:MAG: hypothetical protein WAV28_02765, partial [Sedimentisphaerales bacterium]
MARLFGFRLKDKRSGENCISNYSDNGCAEEISGLSQLYCPEQDSTAHVRDVADVLCEMGKVTAKQLSKIRGIQKKRADCDVCQIIAELKLADEPEISKAQASLYGFEFRQVEPEQVDREAFDKLELVYIRSNHIMPIAIHGKSLVVATSRPADLFIIEDVKRQTQMNVKTVVCLDKDIDKVCATFGDKKVDYNIDDIMDDMADVEVVQDQQENSEDLEKMAGQSPVIKFVNYLISNAVREG